MFKRHKHFWNILLLIVLLLVGTGAVRWKIQLQANQRQIQNLKVNQTNIPTLFIPGYLGNKVTFGPMIDRFDKNHLGTDAMLIEVSKSGKITAQHTASLHKNNPLIQVLFATNKDQAVQARHLMQVMTFRKNKYQVKQANLGGHSLGGNIIFDYLGDATRSKTALPTTRKFVNLACDFPDDVNHGKYLQKNLEVLNIAGNMYNLGTDGVVSLKGALLLKQIVQGHVKSYQVHVLNGGMFDAYHSSLHENGQVDRWILEFLFKQK